MNKKDANPWTTEEDTVLLEAYADVGNKWTCISRMLPGRTDNAVKNRHALLQRKRNAQRQRGAQPMRKRSKADPAQLAAPASVYCEGGLHAAPVHYNYVQPSEFYTGMASTSLGADTANLQLLSAYNMQHLHPNLQQLHPSFQPTIFQQQAHDTLLQQHAHMQSVHPPGLTGQYSLSSDLHGGYSAGTAFGSGPGYGAVAGYGAGSMTTSDGLYGVLNLFGHPSHDLRINPHQHAVALGVATGTAVGAEGGDTPSSTGTVTGHPSIFRQSSTVPAERQASHDKEAHQPAAKEPALDCSEYTADAIEHK